MSKMIARISSHVVVRALTVIVAAVIWSGGNAAILHAQQDVVWTKEQIIERLVRTEEQPLTRSLLPRGIKVGEGSGAAAEAAPSGWIDDLLVTFPFDSADITPAARQTLDVLGAALTDGRLSADRFEIAGHTDGVGDESYNATLSERRAQAVVDYLSDHYGISRARLLGRGYGETFLADPEDPAGPENRRVEIMNLGSG
jgi:outer membrane protein OmpA-like peptidoglycan-associated protein